MEKEELPGVFGMVSRFVRNLPGAEFAEEQLHTVERRVLRELKQRLDGIDERRLPTPANYSPAPIITADEGGHSVQVVQQSGLGQHPGELLAELMDRAMDQDRAQAQLYLFAMILSELVPDEARILGALSDGDSHPLLHLGIGGPIGTPRVVAENFSTVGKAGRVKLLEFTPAYIAHLRNLDLLETGPEDKEFEIKYQILESDRATNEAAAELGKGSGPAMGIKYIRRVIRISPLGKELWETCQGFIHEEE